ncbi:MAG: DUF2207 domain-containing protein [Gammaproteobacteria bacterium]|nr:DUF2207 domain-containing protein [Gammaproteobacteria bacterium]MBU2678032.1 DUF2207 domain-containing protein [Gammaproteobacteria bacterium]NNC55992.1 DUF2207 domain-containing protein [Woeseiaceae bacterium]NNL51767.1 DUF2207 domain-containing protein [Woeseiaceae bacterium]
MKWTGLLVLLLLPLSGLAGERILKFHSDIRVMTDGMIEVTETITVQAEGNRIKRGIYRDFPTEYEDKLGNEYVVAFEPLAVLRNDSPEAFHTQAVRRGIRTYFGRSNRFIDPGVHTYTFRYRASRMLGFFDDHDELYWNVTGFDWAFPIDKASATVALEFEAPLNGITHEAYTGPFGAKGRDYRSRLDSNRRVTFEANKPLSPVNGLTIVVGWPKGFVTAPTNADRVAWLLKDNKNLLAALIGYLLLLAYYIPVWRKYGRDPDEGVFVTRYEPPDGFSPASLRYIRQMYYDNKVMTAAIVNLAVKGYLEIEQRGDSHWLKARDTDELKPPMAAGEQELYNGLFKGSGKIELDNKNHGVLGKARAAHKKSLKKDYKQHYFKTNGTLNIPAIVIVIGSMLIALNIGRGPTPLVIATIVLSFLTMAYFAIIMKRPTLRGRKLLDEMLGFKDFLEIAEKDELNLRNPPQKTPQLFEAFLPFALALGVDQEWSERFATVLANVRDPNGREYQPSWYNGSWNSSNLSKTTSKLSSSLHSAVSSSVSPPGSSSGGGGGGSSGGGGGGGGGGGW